LGVPRRHREIREKRELRSRELRATGAKRIDPSKNPLQARSRLLLDALQGRDPIAVPRGGEPVALRVQAARSGTARRAMRDEE
jgi:hypothetical protein